MAWQYLVICYGIYWRLNSLMAIIQRYICVDVCGIPERYVSNIIFYGHVDELAKLTKYKLTEVHPDFNNRYYSKHRRHECSCLGSEPLVPPYTSMAAGHLPRFREGMESNLPGHNCVHPLLCCIASSENLASGSFNLVDNEVTMVSPPGWVHGIFRFEPGNIIPHREA